MAVEIPGFLKVGEFYNLRSNGGVIPSSHSENLTSCLFVAPESQEHGDIREWLGFAQFNLPDSPRIRRLKVPSIGLRAIEEELSEDDIFTPNKFQLTQVLPS